MIVITVRRMIADRDAERRTGRPAHDRAGGEETDQDQRQVGSQRDFPTIGQLEEGSNNNILTVEFVWSSANLVTRRNFQGIPSDNWQVPADRFEVVVINSLLEITSAKRRTLAVLATSPGWFTPLIDETVILPRPRPVPPWLARSRPPVAASEGQPGPRFASGRTIPGGRSRTVPEPGHNLSTIRSAPSNCRAA